MKLQFSGHDSFICKHFWLKKGYEYAHSGGNFNSEEAIMQLGVGKNMVTAINYWLKAFGVLDGSNDLTAEGKYIFEEADPYLEDLGTVWLLHYLLLKTNKASIYNLFFNEFRKGKFEFTKEQLFTFLRRETETHGQSQFTHNTINTDIAVFLRNYHRPDFRASKIDIEDDFSGLLMELELLETYHAENIEGKKVDWYKVESKQRDSLPYQIVLFSILDNAKYGQSISFNELLNGHNSPGRLFAINEDGLLQKLEDIAANYNQISFTESAGVREIQLKKKLDKYTVLNGYY